MLEPIGHPLKIRPFIKPLIIQILVALLFLYLAMPAKAFTQYMVWDFENNCNSWSNQFIKAVYPNGRCGENTTAQKVVGDWSLYFKADGNIAGDDGWYNEVSNGTIATYDWRFFFWLKMQSTSTSGSYTGLQCGLAGTSPTMFWLVGFEPEGSGFRVGAYVGADLWQSFERFLYKATPTVFDMNTWYAFQLRHNYTATQTTLWYSTDGEDWIMEKQLAEYEASIPTKFHMGHQIDCHVYYGWTDYWVVTESTMYSPPPPPPPPFDFIGHYFGIGLFLAGVIMMIFAPSWVAWKVKKSGITPDTVERFGYAMLIFLFGFGLFINYIYGV